MVEEKVQTFFPLSNYKTSCLKECQKHDGQVKILEVTGEDPTCTFTKFCLSSCNRLPASMYQGQYNSTIQTKIDFLNARNALPPRNKNDPSPRPTSPAKSHQNTWNGRYLSLFSYFKTHQITLGTSNHRYGRQCVLFFYRFSE